MSDTHDPTIRAAVVELGMAAEEAPTWEQIVRGAEQPTTAVSWMSQRRIPNWAAAVAAAVIVLFAVGGTLLLLGPSAEVAETPTTPAPPTTALPTTVPPPLTTEAVSDTSEVEALVAEYYAAYNAGDVEGALGLLSSSFRVVSPANLQRWVGILGEQIIGDCRPAPDYADGLLCFETYQDGFHGMAGLSLRSTFLYFERDGFLAQTHPPGAEPYLPGCLQGRCPQTYDRFADDLFEWLGRSYPAVAAQVDGADDLYYSVPIESAVAAVLPYVPEFLTQSPTWRQASSVTDGMSADSVVAEYYDAVNSRDPERLEEFMGAPTDEAMLWLWGLGTQWDATCTPDAADPSVVRCEETWRDDFYTKAGAQFTYGIYWSVVDGRVSNVNEWQLTSSYWAYADFENDFGAWLAKTHPEEHLRAFEGIRLARTPEAAAIAVVHIEDFLAQSDDYPRSADPINELSN